MHFTQFFNCYAASVWRHFISLQMTEPPPGKALFVALRFAFSVRPWRILLKIRLLCYAPMLPTTSYYALGWVL